MKQNLSGKQNFTGPGENSGNSFRPFPGDKIIYTALILLCLVITSAIAGIRPAAGAAAGEGTENNPWKVTTWSELCETLQPGCISSFKTLLNMAKAEEIMHGPILRFPAAYRSRST